MSDTEPAQLTPGRKGVGKIPDGGGLGTKRDVYPITQAFTIIHGFQTDDSPLLGYGVPLVSNLAQRTHDVRCLTTRLACLVERRFDRDVTLRSIVAPLLGTCLLRLQFVELRLGPL